MVILSLLGYWDVSMVKATVFWFIGSALVVLFNINKALREEEFFLNVFMDNIKLVLVIELLANFHVFSFVTELVILPLIVLFALLKAYSEAKAEYKQIGKLMNGALTIIGLVFLSLSIKDAFNNIGNFASYTTLKSFLLPIILSISFLPCVYVIAVVMEYELLFIRLRKFLKNKDDLAFSKRRIMLKGLISLKKLKQLSSNINELLTDPREMI
jgi:hypothetical protein